LKGVVVGKPVNQNEVGPKMAITMILPGARKGVVAIFDLQTLAMHEMH
jgi:hypothetical protein